MKRWLLLILLTLPMLAYGSGPETVTVQSAREKYFFEAVYAKVANAKPPYFYTSSTNDEHWFETNAALGRPIRGLRLVRKRMGNCTRFVIHSQERAAPESHWIRSAKPFDVVGDIVWLSKDYACKPQP